MRATVNRQPRHFQAKILRQQGNDRIGSAHQLTHTVMLAHIELNRSDFMAVELVGIGAQRFEIGIGGSDV